MIAEFIIAILILMGLILISILSLIILNICNVLDFETSSEYVKKLLLIIFGLLWTFIFSIILEVILK